MSDPTQTTKREAVVVIAEALIPVCSDGNSDALAVASDVLDVLRRDGWSLVKTEPSDVEIECREASDLLKCAADQIAWMKRQKEAAEQGHEGQRRNTMAFLRERDEARRCLAFFASAIKCGAPWSDTCEAEYRKAMQNV